ncbi:MAG: transcription antitermination protein NusB [Leptolyngbya sp. SIO4C1]|nr:transcription antitermination protein NusB [Leptolyngbya sp. SIO4C1]
MQARRIARELALLGMSQLSDTPEKARANQAGALSKDLDTLLSGAVRTLSVEIKETLENASLELERGNRHLLNSETRSTELRSARAMVKDAIEQTQLAINRLGAAVELPEFVQIANRPEVQSYAKDILTHLTSHLSELDTLLDEAMVGWNLKRLARIDRDILRIALTEILYLGVPKRIAIDESIEVAKRYSDEDGYRFINGVMRRVTDRLEAKRRSDPASSSPDAS